MDTIKIARRLAELGQTADAQRAYTLALQAAGLSPEEELNRFEAARRGAIDQLEDLYGRALDQAGMEAAAIFRIHQMLLEDPDYQEAVHTSIRRGEGACQAVQRAGARFTALFSAMEDEYMQARREFWLAARPAKGKPDRA